MIHPLFAGFDEGHNMQRVAEALGFDSRFRTMDLEDMGDSEQEAYDRDGMKFIDAWAPEVPDGFELAGKWDHEDGPVAMFVRPNSKMAEALWVVASAFVEDEATVPEGDRECWSADGENFSFRSLGELLERYDDLRPGSQVQRGATVHPDPTGFVDADHVIEGMGERAYDVGGEFAEDYPDVTKAARKQLEAYLDYWALTYCQPTFYGVSDVRPYTITAADIESAGADRAEAME